MAISDQHGCSASDWVSVFLKAGVRVDQLNESKAKHSKATMIGRFFSPHVGREVPIQVNGRSGKAVLRVEEGRAKEKRYYFEIALDAPQAVEPDGKTAGEANEATSVLPTASALPDGAPSTEEMPPAPVAIPNVKPQPKKKQLLPAKTPKPLPAKSQTKGGKVPSSQSKGNEEQW